MTSASNNEMFKEAHAFLIKQFQETENRFRFSPSDDLEVRTQKERDLLEKQQQLTEACNALFTEMQTAFANDISQVTFLSKVLTDLEKESLHLSRFMRTWYPLASVAEPQKVRARKTTKESPLLRTNRFDLYRDIAGDGNCFYTSLTVGYLEAVTSPENRHLLERLFTILTIMEHNNDSTTPSPLSSEFYVTIKTTLQNLQENPDRLEEVLADNDQILPIVRLLREILYLYYRKPSLFREVTINDNLQEEIPFCRLLNMKEIQSQFCLMLANDLTAHNPGLFDSVYNDLSSQPFEQVAQKHLRNMGSYAFQIPINTLCRILLFPISITFLDFDEQFTQNTIKNLVTPEKMAPLAYLFHNVNHYFNVYPSPVASTADSLAFSQPPIPDESEASPETVFTEIPITTDPPPVQLPLSEAEKKNALVIPEQNSSSFSLRAIFSWIVSLSSAFFRSLFLRISRLW